jgi:DNA-directed RNA polymerase subunit beta
MTTETLSKQTLIPAKRVALRDRQFAEVDDSEVDYDFEDPSQYFGTHVNLIPLQSAVAGPRLFYGARFYNQAMPLLNAEAPLVQTLDKRTSAERGVETSMDDIMGDHAGNIRADADGLVQEVDQDNIVFTDSKGKKRAISLYRDFPFNRKSSITNTAMVRPGDVIKPGQLLAKSNYTDNNGTLSIGVNARMALIPFKGHSMDDAMVISEAFAKRLTSQHLYGHDLDYKRGVKGGKAHYTGLFPQEFNKDQLGKLDDDGVVTVGQVLQPGDPVILATKPRVISSSSAQLGLLSKHMRNARQPAVTKWDHDTPGRVVDVEKLRGGVKVNIASDMPVQIGDKLAMRAGQKGVVSLIIPDEQMPRTADGKPLEVLLNQLGIPSRVNSSLLYELLLGKVAQKTGKTYRLPAFTDPGTNWYDIVEQELQKNGVPKEEEVFDPALNRKLDNPVTVGVGTMLKLHHTSSSKVSVRGQAAYDNNQQPLHGGGEAGQSKRLSGLESHSLLSSGAYSVLREGSTIRGQRNDEYWRDLRQGYTPKNPGEPFVWNKFRMLLNGSGYQMKNLGDGRERLQFWTDRDLDRHKPIEVRNGELLDIGTMQPVKGGLFDDTLTGANSWGFIRLPHPVPNPAAEDVVRKLLGITEKQFRAIMAGEAELPEHLR